MQGNVNIPDSTITTNLSFRQLVLMNMQQLTNFPYIEKDFDALTDYELLCLVVKYLNNVIANQNEQNDSITRMYESFLALQTYVNNTKDTLEDAFNTLDDYVRNYFDNLDVQDEIDHKLDEYVEDGTLEHIIASYLNTQKIYNTTVEMLADADSLVDGLNVQTLGYYNINDKGGAFYQITDTASLTDYQIDLQNGLYANLILNDKELNIMQLGLSNKSDYTTDFANLDNIINKLKIEKIVFNQETYNVTQPVTFDIENKKIVFDFNGATIKLNANIRYFDSGIFTINMNKDIESECYLLNGAFDGSGVTPSFLATDTSPNGGRGMFFINGARYIGADNLYFNDWFYSACIWSHYCSNADITNITGVRVGGRSATNSEDARGDALYFGYTGVVYDNENQIDEDNSQNVNIRVENCSFSSWEAIENTSADSNVRNGSQSGRCGITFGEFSKTNSEKNLYLNNCYFYNYQRTIHIENIYNVNIEINNTTFENYGEILLLSSGITGNSITFNNCVFDKNVDVIAIYPTYKVLFNGHTENMLKNIIVNNSIIKDQYGGLLLYCKDINTIFNNCDIEFNDLKIVNNCYPIFIDSKVKYNRTEIYNSIVKFDNCQITGGFKNDASSKCFLHWTGSGYYNSTNNIINNCKCLNVGTVEGANKFIITNNDFLYDEHFVNTDNNSTTRTAYFGVYPNRLSKLSNNIITNNYNNIKKIIDNSTNETASYQINDNIFNNVILSLFNVTEFKCRIYNNLFKNTDESTTNAGDLYGSKAVVFNNQFIGYQNAFVNKGNCTQFNNYISTDGTTNTLVS